MYALHSWLRYVVFLLGLSALGFALWGVIRKRPYQKMMWTLSSYFTVGLYVQVVLGFLLIFSTTNRSFDRSMGLHMVFSMVAAVVAQTTYSANRRRAREERRYSIHVWGVGISLALVAAAILVIGRPIIG